MSHWQSGWDYWREPALAGRAFPGLENIQSWCDLLLLASASPSGSELKVRTLVTWIGRSMEESMRTGKKPSRPPSEASSDHSSLQDLSAGPPSVLATNLRMFKCGRGELQKSLFKYSVYNCFFWKKASCTCRQQAWCKWLGVCYLELHSYQTLQVKQSKMSQLVRQKHTSLKMIPPTRNGSFWLRNGNCNVSNETQ